MIIYHNIPALNSWRNLTMTNSSMAKSLEKLSSGLRINRAADDAAGLAISEKMRAQIRGLNQAVRNAQDGISLIQTAEGALNETHSILQRMRELAVQAANDTLTSSDRGEIQKEIDQLTAELNRIANTTEFNTKKLLDGSASALTSSDKLTTKIFMRDGLRTVDQYGQKVTNSGNYELRIGVKEIGQSEVQKSDVFNVKHAYNGIENLRLGAADTNNTVIGARNYVAGSYALGTELSKDTTKTLSAGATITQVFNSGGAQNIIGSSAAMTLLVTGSAGTSLTSLSSNLNSLIEITNINKNSDGTFDLTYRVSTHKYGVDGAYEFKQESNVVAGLKASAANSNIQLKTGLKNDAGADLYYTVATPRTADLGLLRVGDKTVVNVTATVAQGDSFTLVGTAEGDKSAHKVTQIFNSGYFDKTQRTFNLYSLDTVNGNAYNGSITVGFDYDYAKDMKYTETNISLAFTSAGGTFNAVASGVTTTTVKFNVTLTADTTISAGNFLLNDIYIDGNLAHKAGTTLESDLLLKAGAVLGNVTLTLTGLAATGSSTTDVATAAKAAYAAHVAYPLTIDYVTPGDAATFNVSPALGRSASLDTRLYDIDKFWDSNGNFLLKDPQQITLIQGDGNKATITLDSNDTIFTVQHKMNNAIRDGLGQGAYVDSSHDRNFVQFVYNKEDTGFKDHSAYSVNGTFVIQSAIAGKSGEIRLVGDDNLINAFSLANIRSSSENTFNVWHKDAHSTTPFDIAPNATIAGNLLVGVIHPNVDVMFDSNASLKTIDEINSATGLFMFKAETNANNFHTTTIHLADNTMVFQIGANPNQDVNASIGDMGALALGVNNVLVTDRSSATNALSKIDQAINRVSGERAKMGALQNRLEHTISNLGVAAENLSAAESRIRDVDMAAEMMNMTKLQILAQAGTAMMAQANAMPQMVLRLLGG